MPAPDFGVAVMTNSSAETAIEILPLPSNKIPAIINANKADVSFFITFSPKKENTAVLRCLQKCSWLTQ